MKSACVIITLGVLAAARAAAAQPALPGDAEIRRILVDRIDVQKRGVGIVVGVIEPAGRRVVSHGRLAEKDARPLNGDTLFEIGSATKVFTSLLLADAVERDELALIDPVTKFLPPEVKVPVRRVRRITLEDLATHTSGLPRLPTNLAPKDPGNPYADYTVQQLYAFLSSYALPRDVGAAYEYSNLGAGLLGHALSRRAGMDFETLVRTRITRPLGMNSTAITLSDVLQKRLAPGHDEQLGRAANWDLPTLPGAGALRSTANDLLKFLSAILGYQKTTLAPAMRSQLEVRRKTSTPGLEIALGWHVLTTASGREIVWHNGGTGGYRSFIGFDPPNRTGVVVLSNTFTNTGVDDIGRHLLDRTFPLLQAPKQRKEIAVDAKVFDRYVGRYEFAPNFILVITREGDHFFAQATAQPKFEIFAESEREFFLKAVDAQITFYVNDQGRATGMILHQNGRDVPARRIDGDPVPQKERKAIALDPTRLGRYVGRYQLAPEFVLTVTGEANRLFLQATGQLKSEIFAESERHFFLKVVDAQITFEGDDAKHFSRLILHQNGVDQVARRIE